MDLIEKIQSILLEEAGMPEHVDKPGKETEGEGEVPESKEKKIIAFISKQENLDDSDFHTFVEKMGIEPHEAEEVIYKAFREMAKKNSLKENTIPNFTEDVIIKASKDGKLNIMDYDMKQLIKGMEVELEHGTKNPEYNLTNDDPIMTLKIVLAHMKEGKKYYLPYLDNMEKQLKKSEGKKD